MATFTLFDLTYRVARELGIVREGVATGGSTTTIIDTNERTEEFEYFKGGTAWILRDSAGAGAAPEKEFSRITTNAKVTNTLTLASTLTAAVASGDRYAAATDLVPLNQIISQINGALTDMGPVPTTYTGITTADDQTEYTLPAAAGMDIRQVWFQTDDTDADDNRWVEIREWRVQQAAAGSADTIILDKQPPSGYKLKIVYMATHAPLQVSTDPLNEHVPIERVVYSAAALCMTYLGLKTDWTKWSRYVDVMTQRAEQARQTRPIIVPRRPSRLMIVTSDQGDKPRNDFTPNRVDL